MNPRRPVIAECPPGEYALAPARFLALTAGAAVAWILFQLGWMTAHVFNATRFLLYDQGSYLYALGRWQAGEALYRDLAWQYGPLALAWYRAFAAIGGNSPLSLVVAGSAAFALAWVLTAALVWRAAGRTWGGGLALAGLLPMMAVAGLNAINGPHGAVEMLLLAAIAWTLGRKSPGGPWVPCGLGVLVGLLQWVRFGPQVMALGAIVIIAAWQRSQTEASGRAFAREMAVFMVRLLAGYAVCIVPLAAWYFSALPATGAQEQLWPMHMVAHYAATYPHRWPRISSPGELGLTWLPALLGVGLALMVLFSGFSRRGYRAMAPAPAAIAGLIFFPLYYALSCVGLFHNDYAMIGHLWLAWPGLALAARLPRAWMRLTVVIAVAPAILATAAGIWKSKKEERTWQSRPLVMPNGQSLWFSPGEEKRFGELRAALGPAPQTRRLAVFLAGGGIHHFFGTQRVGRHWWFLPEFVRPWEMASVQETLLRHELILVADLGQVADAPPASGVLPLWLPLPRPMAEQLLPHLKNPRHLDGVGDLLEVTP